MRCLCLILVAFLTLSDVPTSATDLPPEVETVLSQHCFKCHGEKKQSGKLDLRTVESIYVGGKRGPGFVASDVESSRIVQLVRPGAKPHMPPGKKPQLSDAEISTLAEWIHGLSADEMNNRGEVLPLAEVASPKPAVDSAKQTGVDDEPQLAAQTVIDPSAAIDRFVAEGYQQRQIVPAKICDDATFARRVYLDLLGRLPTTDESQDFLAAGSPRNRDHRNEMIDRLLTSDEFPQHWSKLFDAMLMGRKERRLSDRKRHGWHAYLEDVFRHQRPWNEVAREILLARGGVHGGSKEPGNLERGHLWFLYERENKHQDMAEAIARGFFGVDIACAQCHDHPLAFEIEQAHYWGLVGFFKRTTNTKTENGIALAESAIGGFDSYANALTGSTDESLLTFLDRQPVPETRPEKPDKQEDSDELYTNVEHEPRVPKFSRRQKFVDEILDGHPLLARAMVNRVWAILLGRGLVHPIDKMDSEHPASHPELLDWLAEDFAEYGYNIPRLIAAIAKSQTYQLDSQRPTDDNNNPVEPSTFAYGLQKPLPAESAIRALQIALGLPDEEMEVKNLGKEFRKLFPDVVARNQQTTLNQTMMLSNHPQLREVYDRAAAKLIREATQSPSGEVLEKQLTIGDEFIQGLYDRVFVRQADHDESEAIRNYLQSRKSRLQTALADVLWAMTTSAEFRFNH